ncbi:MAG: MBL fold metallo-hydrolase [Anaerolineae bacterium]|nr:MBL fold metallo-hydrolase [Anaerolineae bacterium]
MDITWYGHSCFRLVERGKATVITDPYNGGIGYKFPKKLRADIVTISHNAPGHANLEAWPKETHIIDHAGEYEIGDVFIIGVATHNPENPAQQNIVYVLDFDGLNVVHLGDLSYIPTQAQVDSFGTVNVALVPVGGGNGLNAGQAAEVISLIEPDIVVPMHYQTPLTTLDLEPLDRFLKVMGLGNVQAEEMLRITTSSLPPEPQVVVLEPQQ